MTLETQSLDRQKIAPIAEVLESFEKKECHIEEKSSRSGQMAGQSSFTRTFFLKPICLGSTPFYIDPLFKNKIFLTQKFVLEGLSAKQIAREIFSSKTAVLEGLARFGIPIREPHHHHGHPSQPRYGRRFYQDRLVDFRLERDVILMIKDLRSKGYSLRRIARMLNIMAVPTKCHGKAWHPEMVRRVLGAQSSTDN